VAWPEDATLHALHERLLEGTEEAREQLAGLVLANLRAALSRRWRRADPDDVCDSAEDALLRYFAQPQLFDAGRGSLRGLLIRYAINRLRTLHRTRQRRSKRELADSVGGAVQLRTPQDRSLRHLGRQIETVLRTATERAFLAAWLRGIRDPMALAAALGLPVQDLRDARASVRRARERLRLRFKRAARRRSPLRPTP